MFRIINVRHFAEKAFYASTKLGNKYITLFIQVSKYLQIIRATPRQNTIY